MSTCSSSRPSLMGLLPILAMLVVAVALLLPFLGDGPDYVPPSKISVVVYSPNEAYPVLHSILTYNVSQDPAAFERLVVQFRTHANWVFDEAEEEPDEAPVQVGDSLREGEIREAIEAFEKLWDGCSDAELRTEFEANADFVENLISRMREGDTLTENEINVAVQLLWSQQRLSRLLRHLEGK